MLVILDVANDIAGQSVGGADGRKTAAFEPNQPAPKGSNPQRTIPVQPQAMNEITAQSVHLPELAHGPVFQQTQTSPQHPKPDRPLAVLHHRSHVRLYQALVAVS